MNNNNKYFQQLKEQNDIIRLINRINIGDRLNESQYNKIINYIITNGNKITKTLKYMVPDYDENGFVKCNPNPISRKEEGYEWMGVYVSKYYGQRYHIQSYNHKIQDFIDLYIDIEIS